MMNTTINDNNELFTNHTNFINTLHITIIIKAKTTQADMMTTSIIETSTESNFIPSMIRTRTLVHYQPYFYYTIFSPRGKKLKQIEE